MRNNVGGREPGSVPEAIAGTIRTGIGQFKAIDMGMTPLEIAFAPTILDHLASLAEAEAQIANTWMPNDPAYRADIYRQTMMNLSFSYFAFFHADAEHPDWAPLWNPVFTHQPNPDDLYLYSPIRGDLTYRVSGNRGTVHKLIFVTQHGMTGAVDDASEVYDSNLIDETGFEVDANGDFELLFSAERPAGHTGNWARMAPSADNMMVRFRSNNWADEIDPRISIECLDPVPPKARLTPEQILDRLGRMASFPGRRSKVFLSLQNGIKDRVGINRFETVRHIGLGVKQIYWPAVFELEDDEALIIETEMPRVRPYWNIQLNDPYFNAVEYVYRISSLNGETARLSSDGRFRAVIALTDPEVPNWLDPAGFRQGTIYGRWYDCDSNPMPTIKRVKLADLRQYLPADTPRVLPAERKEAIMRQVRAAQRRRRW